MPDRARLIIHGHGEVEANSVALFLSELINVYECLTAFEKVTRRSRYGDVELYYAPPPLSFSRRSRPASLFDARQIADTASSFVLPRERLLFRRAQLASPGFWEFMGTLNPLEVTRKYLNDRHERRKDRDYREDAEARRLQLQNLVLENQVISDRLSLLRDAGYTDREIAPMLNELVYRPLSRLEHRQDEGVISTAELRRDEGD